MGIRVASWYPAPEAGLNLSQLADVVRLTRPAHGRSQAALTRTAPRNP